MTNFSLKLSSLTLEKFIQINLFLISMKFEKDERLVRRFESIFLRTMEPRTCFVILNLILYIHQVESDRCGDIGNNTRYVIGVYSACYGQANRTELNLLAEDLDTTVDYMWNIKVKDTKMNLKYISIDICMDFHRLPKLVESIYLDEEYHYETWSQKWNKTILVSTVVAIYAEVPTDMMDFLEASFVDDYRFTGNYVSFNTSIGREYFEVYSSIIYFVVQRLKWDHLLILSVQPSLLTLLNQMLVQKAQASKLCVHYIEVDESWSINQEKYFTRDWFRENKPAVITIGDKSGQVEIIKGLANFTKTNNLSIPILTEGFLTSLMLNRAASSNFNCFKELSASLLSTELSAFSYFEFTLSREHIRMIKDVSFLVNRTISPSQRFALMQSLWLSDLYADDATQRLSCNCSIDFYCIEKGKRVAWDFEKTWDYAFKTRQDQYHVSMFLLDPELPFSATMYEKYRKGHWGCREHVFLSQHYSDVLIGKESENPLGKSWPSLTEINRIESSQCPNLNCHHGFYKAYQKVKHGFSWVCIACPKDSIKPDFGNHQCTPCTGKLSKDNGGRTACVDPYTNINIDYLTKEFYIIGSTSLIGLLIVITTFIIFIINRNTPIVMTSDFKISIFHLCVHFLTLLTLLVLIFARTNFCAISRRGPKMREI